jgi:hypothetical protein
MYQSYRTSRGKPEPYQKTRCSRCRGTGDAPCGICGGVGKVPKGCDAHGHTRFSVATAAWDARPSAARPVVASGSSDGYSTTR